MANQPEIKAITAELQAIESRAIDWLPPVTTRVAPPQHKNPAIEPTTPHPEPRQNPAVNRSSFAGQSRSQSGSQSVTLPPLTPVYQPDIQQEAVLGEQWIQLDAQADLVNQLADQQERALLNLKTAVEAIEFSTALDGRGYAALNSGMSKLCDYPAVAVPRVNRTVDGRLVIVSQAIDWFKAEREAQLTAAQIRLLKNKARTAQFHGGNSEATGLLAEYVDDPPPELPTMHDWRGMVEQLQARWRQFTQERHSEGLLLGGWFAPPPSRRSVRRRSSRSISPNAAPLTPNEISLPSVLLWVLGAIALRQVLALVAPTLVPFAVGMIIAAMVIVVYKLIHVS